MNEDQILNKRKLEKAFQLLVMGERFDARHAQTAGLITEVTQTEELEAKAMEAATRLANKPPQAVEISRKLLRGNRDEIVDRIQLARFADVHRRRHVGFETGGTGLRHPPWHPNVGMFPGDWRKVHRLSPARRPHLSGFDFGHGDASDRYASAPFGQIAQSLNRTSVAHPSFHTSVEVWPEPIGFALRHHIGDEPDLAPWNKDRQQLEREPQQVSPFQS